MKGASYTTLMLLTVTILFSSLTYGFSPSFHAKSSLSAPTGHGLQVWFDTPYFLEAGPCEYQLVVHAQTASGLWITSLHWNFGDGSTLDVPFNGVSQVRDSRVHGYTTQGTYVVGVTATDSAGNTGTGYWGLYHAFPTSCVRLPSPTRGGSPTTMLSVVPRWVDSIAFSP
jgi:hypothetical protein